MLKRSFEYAKASIFYLLIKHNGRLKRKVQWAWQEDCHQNTLPSGGPSPCVALGVRPPINLSVGLLCVKAHVWEREMVTLWTRYTPSPPGTHGLMGVMRCACKQCRERGLSHSGLWERKLTCILVHCCISGAKNTALYILGAEYLLNECLHTFTLAVSFNLPRDRERGTTNSSILYLRKSGPGEVKWLTLRHTAKNWVSSY